MAEDDATMPDTVEKVAERLAQLEKTVAEGFHDTNARIAAAAINKLDVSVEILRRRDHDRCSDHGCFRDEMRREHELRCARDDAGAL